MRLFATLAISVILPSIIISCQPKNKPSPEEGAEADPTAVATQAAPAGQTTPLPDDQTTPVPSVTTTPSATPGVTNCNPPAGATGSVVFQCVEQEITALNSYLTTNAGQNLSAASDILKDTTWEISSIRFNLTQTQDMSQIRISIIKNNLAILKSKLARASLAANPSPLASTVVAKATAIASLIDRVTVP